MIPWCIISSILVMYQQLEPNQIIFCLAFVKVRYWKYEFPSLIASSLDNWEGGNIAALFTCLNLTAEVIYW